MEGLNPLDNNHSTLTEPPFPFWRTPTDLLGGEEELAMRVKNCITKQPSRHCHTEQENAIRQAGNTSVDRTVPVALKEHVERKSRREDVEERASDAMAERILALRQLAAKGPSYGRKLSKEKKETKPAKARAKPKKASEPEEEEKEEEPAAEKAKVKEEEKAEKAEKPLKAKAAEPLEEAVKEKKKEEEVKAKESRKELAAEKAEKPKVKEEVKAEKAEKPLKAKEEEAFEEEAIEIEPASALY